MDTTQEFQAVLNKRTTRAPITLREMAIVLANDNQSLIDYLIMNDFKQVYRLLNASSSGMRIGDNAGMLPDLKRTRAEMQAHLGRKDWDVLNYVLSNFRINLQAHNWTSHNDLLEKMSDIQLIYPVDGTYGFKAQFA